ncbi:hypothetical protein [Clostridium sp. C2-6-12]|uniref:hypothetical protein n=1 Tax=Clostridium sp. C2-6-12 TaxID=2698832 RepID=UPI00136C2D17|nr:hypothetical protein [Clostridium sp. C2-6-12]
MSIRELNKEAEKIGFLSSRQANHVKSFKITSISKESSNMKKYILNEDCTISNKNSETLIPKGTEVVDKNNHVDENGGVKATVVSGKYKGMEVIFSIGELTTV